MTVVARGLVRTARFLLVVAQAFTPALKHAASPEARAPSYTSLNTATSACARATSHAVAVEHDHRFDVRRVRKHVERIGPLDRVAGVDDPAGVAGQRRDVAADSRSTRPAPSESFRRAPRATCRCAADRQSRRRAALTGLFQERLDRLVMRPRRPRAARRWSVRSAAAKVAFDRRHRAPADRRGGSPKTARRRHRDRADRRCRRHQIGDVRDEIAQQIPVALKERPHVPPQLHRREVTDRDRVGDRGTGPRPVSPSIDGELLERRGVDRLPVSSWTTRSVASTFSESSISRTESSRATVSVRHQPIEHVACRRQQLARRPRVAQISCVPSRKNPSRAPRTCSRARIR